MSAGKSKSESGPTRIKKTEAEKQVEELQLQAAAIVLGQLETTAEFQDLLRGVAIPTLEDIRSLNKLERSAFTDEEVRRRLRADAALGDEFRKAQRIATSATLDLIQQGPELRPEQAARIRGAAESAIALGTEDIQRNLGLGVETLRRELAPSLGLRPSDTPIIDRGQRLAEEASRQQGRLVEGIRGRQLEQEVTLPLAEFQAQGQLGLGLGAQGAAGSQFQNLLRQQAFENRLRLSGAALEGGLALSRPAGLPQIQESLRSQIAGEQNTRSATGFGLFGDFGGSLP